MNAEFVSYLIAFAPALAAVCAGAVLSQREGADSPIGLGILAFALIVVGFAVQPPLRRLLDRRR